MQSNYLAYDFSKSIDRIDEILTTGDNAYEEVGLIPSRDRLTYTNGFYIPRCSALFVDIRNSSSLPERYKRPTLARIYRAYVSELVAIINSNPHCAEVNIVGDSVSGIFDARWTNQIDAVFETGAEIRSLIKILNCRLEKRRVEPIRAGVGIAFGRALMIKAGYKGSSINEVVWMGDVVNRAAKLCGEADTGWTSPILVSGGFHSNLKDEYKRMLEWRADDAYGGNVFNLEMEQWWQAKCAPKNAYSFL